MSEPLNEFLEELATIMSSPTSIDEELGALIRPHYERMLKRELDENGDGEHFAYRRRRFGYQPCPDFEQFKL